MGMAHTAIIACFAGPLFNMLIGLGLSLIISTLSGDMKFSGTLSQPILTGDIQLLNR